MGESSKGKLQRLPESWVDRIFATMSAAYGTLFSDRWRGIDINDIRALWADSLASFSDNPECFRGALTGMVDACKFPPTLPEFIALCRHHYQPPPQIVAGVLPAPEVSHELAEKRIDEVSKAIKRPDTYDYKAWAKRLRTRHMSGESLAVIQIAAASEALGEVLSGGLSQATT